MSRLIFSKKYFVRHEEKDFRDDGNSFKFYYYKDILPLSVCKNEYGYFVAIRLDYLGFRYEEYKDYLDILDMFNYCSYVDMEKLVDNCECICKAFNLL